MSGNVIGMDGQPYEPAGTEGTQEDQEDQVVIVMTPAPKNIPLVLQIALGLLAGFGLGTVILAVMA